MSEPYEVGVSPDGTYIYVRNFRVKISLDVAMSFTRDFVALGKEHGIRLCLQDVRGTTSITGVTGKYQYAYEKSESAGLTRDWRIAVLRDAGESSYDFLETVMTNTARALKLFDVEDEAMAWLKGEQSAQAKGAG